MLQLKSQRYFNASTNFLWRIVTTLKRHSDCTCSVSYCFCLVCKCCPSAPLVYIHHRAVVVIQWWRYLRDPWLWWVCPTTWCDEPLLAAIHTQLRLLVVLLLKEGRIFCQQRLLLVLLYSKHPSCKTTYRATIPRPTNKLFFLVRFQRQTLKAIWLCSQEWATFLSQKYVHLSL